MTSYSIVGYSCEKAPKSIQFYTLIIPQFCFQKVMASFQSRYKSHFVKTKSDRKIFFLRHFSKRLSDSTQKGTRFAEFFSKNISTNTPFFNNYCFVSIFGRQKHLMGVRSSIQFQKNTCTMYIAVLLIC